MCNIVLYIVWIFVVAIFGFGNFNFQIICLGKSNVQYSPVLCEVLVSDSIEIELECRKQHNNFNKCTLKTKCILVTVSSKWISFANVYSCCMVFTLTSAISRTHRDYKWDRNRRDKICPLLCITSIHIQDI